MTKGGDQLVKRGGNQLIEGGGEQRKGRDQAGEQGKKRDAFRHGTSPPKKMYHGDGDHAVCFVLGCKVAKIRSDI